MYKLSIIIPIYNVEAYLLQCLESVSEQDHSEIEVIMVNDCSTDNSKGIAEEFERRHKNWKLLNHKTNQGLGPARNTAISAAKGDYLIMLDSDDWLCTSAIDEALDLINNSTFDVAQFGCNKIYSDRTERNVYMDFPKDQLSPLKQKTTLLSQPNYAWLKIVNRLFIEKHKHRFHNIYYEDIPWSIGVALSAEKIIFIPKSICNYRQREGSIIYSQSPRHLDLLKAYELAFSELPDTKLNNKLMRSLNNSFIKAAYYLYRQRHVRLGGDYLDQYEKLYFGILRKNTILPSSLRTLVMHIITLAKVSLNRLTRPYR